MSLMDKNSVQIDEIIDELLCLYHGRDHTNFSFTFNQSEYRFNTLEILFPYEGHKAFSVFNKDLILLLLYLKSADPDNEFFNQGLNFNNRILEKIILKEHYLRDPSYAISIWEMYTNLDSPFFKFDPKKFAKDNSLFNSELDALKRFEENNITSFYDCIDITRIDENSGHLKLRDSSHPSSYGLYYCWLYYEQVFQIKPEIDQISGYPIDYSTFDSREYILNLINAIPHGKLNRDDGSLYNLFNQLNHDYGHLSSNTKINILSDTSTEKFVAEFALKNNVKSVYSTNVSFLVPFTNEVSCSHLFYSGHWDDTLTVQDDYYRNAPNDFFLTMLALNRTNYNGFIPFSGAAFGPFRVRYRDNGSHLIDKLTGLKVEKTSAEAQFVFQNYDLAIIDPVFLNNTKWDPYSDKIKLLDEAIKGVKPNGLVFIQIENRSKNGLSKYIKRKIDNSELSIHSIIQFNFITWLILEKSESFKEIRLFDGISHEEYWEGRPSDEPILKDYKILLDKLTGYPSEDLRIISANSFLKEYNLNIKRFFMPVFEGNSLSKYVRIYKGEKSNCFLESLVGISELSAIPNELIIPEPKPSQKQYRLLEINFSCILIAMQGNSLKPTMFSYKGESIFIKNNVVALELIENVLNVEFLLFALNSDEILEQLQFIRKGVTIPTYGKNDILNLKLKIPKSKHEQARILKEWRQAYFKKNQLDELLQAERIDYHQKMKSWNHTIGQHMLNIQSIIELINHKIGRLTDKQINQKLKIESFDIIRRLNLLEQEFNEISDLSDKYKQGIDFNDQNYPLEKVSIKALYTLTKEILKRNNKPSFTSKLKLELSGEARESSKDLLKLGLYVNEKVYDIFIKNFISNTFKHSGFIEENKEKNTLLFTFEVFETHMNLIIGNNGVPFAEGLGKAEFITFEYTTDTSKGDGIGGNDIDAIANLLKFQPWSLFNNPNEKYPVQFKFQIPLILLD